MGHDVKVDNVQYLSVEDLINFTDDEIDALGDILEFVINSKEVSEELKDFAVAIWDKIFIYEDEEERDLNKQEYEYLVGDFINENCPECGTTLLGNKRGDKWCSYVYCDWGLFKE